MTNTSEKIARIFLVDDHPAVRQGVGLLLAQADHAVCGEADSRAEAFARIGASGANLAILDLSLGDESGLDFIAELHVAGTSVLVYSMHEDPETIEKTFAAGADGYVTKREKAEVLLSAVTDVLAGNRHISPRTAQSLASRALTSPEQKREQLLSDREKEILEKLAAGESNGDIAAAFCLSIKTVESYYARIITKLELTGMKPLRRYAIEKYRPRPS